MRYSLRRGAHGLHGLPPASDVADIGEKANPVRPT